jgi:hypothetical protein
MSSRTLADLKTPEFWLYNGLGGIGFVALVVALNAVAAPTVAVLAIGMGFGLVIDRMQLWAKDRIDARRDTDTPAPYIEQEAE